MANKYKSLNELKDSHQSAKDETDDLTDQAMNLKESHINGAIDSIDKAGHLSDEAAGVVFSAESKLTAELKPILESLKNKIKSSESYFAESELNLKDYYKYIFNNLTESMDGVFGLNKAVCGELTSETVKCNSKCGGSLCEGKCGTNTSQCNGLVDAYNSVLIAREKFEELYNKQEQIFKRILTKVN